MSLKAFHFIFINALSALCFGCLIWKGHDYFSPEGRPADLAFALGSLLAGIGVLIYGRYFLRKMKAVGFL